MTSGLGASTFYWPMRMMPASRRAAAFAVYAFCRSVDDVADGSQPVAERRAALDAWRRRIEGIYHQAYPSPAAPEALGAAIRDFDLPFDAFAAVIDGMAMDVDGPLLAPDLPTLRLYCARVAGAVGRLMVRIFDADAVARDGEGHDRLALALGEALQLTNILRDIDEDAAAGRLYLPFEALESAGISVRDPIAVAADLRLDVACRWLAAITETAYADAAAHLSVLDRRRLWPAAAMMALYRRLFERLVQRGWAGERRRVRLSRLSCAVVTSCCWLGLS